MTVQISKSEESELRRLNRVLWELWRNRLRQKREPQETSKTVQDKAVELILAGCSQYEIARQFGVSKATVASHVANALKKGRLVKVGYGKYAAPQQEEEEKLAVHDEQAVQGGAGQEAKALSGRTSPRRDLLAWPKTSCPCSKSD